MPFIVPFIPLIAAGLTTAGTIYSTVSSHNATEDQIAAQQKAAADAKTAQDAQTRNSAIQAAQQYVPNIQAQLGGAVSPEYYAQTAATQTGYGDQLDAVRQALAMQGLAPSQSRQGLQTNLSFSGSQGGQFDPSQILSQFGVGGASQFHGA